MPRFLPGQPIATEQPDIVVDPGLPVGRHRFQLVVVDDQGNRSAPDERIVQVVRPNPPIGPIGRGGSPPDPGPLSPGPAVTEPIGGIVRPVRAPRKPQRPRRGG
jgi:hypothetical protein